MLYFEVNQGEYNEYISTLRTVYLDSNKRKEIYSSRGADISFDYQTAGIAVLFTMKCEEKRFDDAFQHSSNFFDELLKLENNLKEYINESEHF